MEVEDDYVEVPILLQKIAKSAVNCLVMTFWKTIL